MKFIVAGLYLLSYVPGIVNLTLVWIAWLRSRDLTLKYYFYLLLLFWLTILDTNIEYFKHSYYGISGPSLDFPSFAIGLALSGCFNIVGALFVHSLISRPFDGWYRRLFLCLCSLPLGFLALKLGGFVFGVGPNYLSIAESHFFDLLTSGLLAFVSVHIWLSRAEARRSFHRKLIGVILGLNVVYVPIAIAKTMMTFESPLQASSLSLGNIYFFLGNILSALVVSRVFFLVKPAKEPKNRNLSDPAWELGLSEREQEIAVLIGQGLTNKEAAARLYISQTTVKNHVYNIYRKLGVTNRVALMNYILNKNILNKKSGEKAITG